MEDDQCPYRMIVDYHATCQFRAEQKDMAYIVT